MILRPYQQQASDNILRMWEEYGSLIGVMATGLGKTVLFSDVIKRRAKPAIVLAHRSELIWQAKDKIERTAGLHCEVEMGDYHAHSDLFHSPNVIISTIQTQCSGNDGRGRMGKFDPAKFGTLIIDECHHSSAGSYKRVIDYYRTNPDMRVLGVTATPDRADEEALGQVFEEVACAYDVEDAVDDGWLVPIDQQYVTVSGLDFSEIRTTAGDLNGADLKAVMEAEQNLHGVAGASLEIIRDRRAIVFTASVKCAETIAEIFNRHRPGMASWVCGKTDKDKRRKILEEFAAGKIQVVANCGVLTEGFDDPGVEVVIMARPTKSRALYAQMLGRGTRPLTGIVDGPETVEERRAAIAASLKPGVLVVDFVGNSGRHKLVTSADILGGKRSEEAVARVIKRAKEGGKPLRMADALAEEEEALREEHRLAEEARRARLVARAKYNVQTVSPFDVFRLEPVRARGWDQGKTLSEKQRGLLAKQGIDPDSIPYHQAKQLIGELFTRWEGKLCTFKQAKILQRFGYDASKVPMDRASKLIDAIAAAGWRRPTIPPPPKLEAVTA